MLTNKGQYGLKAMVYLAGCAPGEPALVTDIAAKNNIPKKFLDSILGELRNAGVVHSKKGRGGGYILAKSAIAEVLDNRSLAEMRELSEAEADSFTYHI